jgi:hypothetical protein
MSLTRTLLVAAATAALLGSGLSPAGAGPDRAEPAARPLDWTRTADPVVLRPSTAVRDIACPPSGAACVAVGQRRDALGARRATVQRWDGTAWTAETPPRGEGLVEVSCSTVDDCVALEEPRWEGGLSRRVAVRSSAGWRWVDFAVQDEAFEVTSVSCASPAWCMLTGTNRQVAVLDGGVLRWLPRTPTGVDSISCTSATRCAAAGGSAFLDWDGTRWSATALESTGHVTDLDCWADRRCLAVVGSDDGSVSAHVSSPEAGWATTAAPPGAPVSSDFGPSGVDCDSRGSCHHLHQVGPSATADLALATWAAGTWVSTPLATTDGHVVALGCRPEECVVVAVAVSAYGEPLHSSALHGAGAQWAARVMVNPVGRIPGFAPHETTCTTRGWCLVLGTAIGDVPSFGRTTVEPYVVRGYGEHWQEMPAALADQRDLDCWRPGACVVAGSDGRWPRASLLGDGRWRVLPALSAPWMAAGVLTGVGCAGRRCVYSGFYRARNDAGLGIFVARRSGGTWRAERLGPVVRNEGRFTARPSLDCPTPSRCVVVTSMRLHGDREPTSFEAVLDGDRWRWARLGAGFSLFEVDCADAERCVAGGQAGEAGLVMAKDGDGRWRRVDVRTRIGSFYSVSCPTTDTCYAAGPGSRVQLLTRTPGGWRPRPVGPRGMTDVACSGPRACLAFNGARTWLGT